MKQEKNVPLHIEVVASFALHVKCYCQKERFVCIYVIIKIAQLVTHDDYAIIGDRSLRI